MLFLLFINVVVLPGARGLKVIANCLSQYLRPIFNFNIFLIHILRLFILATVNHIIGTMKKLICFSIFFALSSIALCEVTGHAYLDGLNDHSGIKVKFIPYSPTAQLDSVYTNTSGDYAISIQPGVYTIEFSKSGYLPQYYNSGNYITLVGNELLDPITLLPSNGIYVSGSINGNWTNENIYFIVDDAFVAEGNSLTINEGTIIKIYDDCNIQVYGSLFINGTVDNPVLMTCNSNYQTPGAWGNLIFNYANSSSLDYCIMQYGNHLSAWDSDVILTNCEIKHFMYGLTFDNCPLIIENNVFFSNNYDEGVKFNNCIDFIFKENQLISDMINNEFKGLYVFDSYGLIENNVLRGNLNTGIDSYGIYIDNLYSSDTLQISNNIISNFGYGIFAIFNTRVAVINNTIYGNYTKGVEISMGYALIQSNCIANNSLGIESLGNIPSMNISYNNIWNNQVNFSTNIPGFGQIISTNSNGDPCDPYFNISLDPLFVSTFNNDFHVFEGSPVIDAGSNSNVISEFDFDGNPRILDGNGDGNAIVDMSVFEVPVELVMTSDFTCPDSVCSEVPVSIEYLGTPLGVNYHWDFDGGIIFSGSGQGPYEVYWEQPGSKTISLYLSLGNDLSDTTYHTIEVQQTLEVSLSIAASSNPVCLGSPVNFTAYAENGGDSPVYQWKLNGLNVGTNSPVYTNTWIQNGNMIRCYLYSSVQCPSQTVVSSEIITMNVINYPYVSVFAFPNDTACISNSITLDAGNPGYEYLWSTGQTTQSIVIY